MKKNKNFIVPLVIYPFEVMFSLGQTDSELKKDFKKCKIKYHGYFKNPLLRARCTRFPGGNCVIRVAKYPTDPDYLGSLQHEIFHAAHLTFQGIGIKLSNKSDEAYAYLIGYITKEVYKKIM